VQEATGGGSEAGLTRDGLSWSDSGAPTCRGQQRSRSTAHHRRAEWWTVPLQPQSGGDRGRWLAYACMATRRATLVGGTGAGTIPAFEKLPQWRGYELRNRCRIAAARECWGNLPRGPRQGHHSNDRASPASPAAARPANPAAGASGTRVEQWLPPARASPVIQRRRWGLPLQGAASDCRSGAAAAAAAAATLLRPQQQRHFAAAAATCLRLQCFCDCGCNARFQASRPRNAACPGASSRPAQRPGDAERRQSSGDTPAKPGETPQERRPVHQV